MTYSEALDYLKTVDPLRVTVSGDIGAGKSTFSKRLSLELDIPRTYIGQFMREEAKRRGMTLDEFNELLEKDDQVDRDMDAMQKQMGEEIARGVFEGRTAWHFVENPDARVFLSVDPKVAANRIWGDKANHMRDAYSGIEEIEKANAARKQNEINRYESYYQIDVYDHNNFDLILDTTNQNIDEVFENGVIQLAEFLKNR